MAAKTRKIEIPVSEAKAQFSELASRAESGEEIVLTKYGRPIGRVTAVPKPGNTLIGCMKDQFEISDDFNNNDPEIEALIYTSELFPQ